MTYNFVAGEEGIPSFTRVMAAQEKVFVQALQAASPDFKPTNFYGGDAPGQAEMAISTNAVGEKFRCLALTLELPFKDVASNPGASFFWEPILCMAGGISRAASQCGSRAPFDSIRLSLALPIYCRLLSSDRFHGWSPERSMHFGRTALQALHQLLLSMSGAGEGAAGEGAGAGAPPPAKRQKAEVKE